jgi:hypothetical protein
VAAEVHGRWQWVSGVPQIALRKVRRCRHPRGLLSASSSQQQLHSRHAPSQQETLQQSATALPLLAQVLALLLLWVQGSLLNQAVQEAHHPGLA